MHTCSYQKHKDYCVFIFIFMYCIASAVPQIYVLKIMQNNILYSIIRYHANSLQTSMSENRIQQPHI